jgi:hypothetical protein
MTGFYFTLLAVLLVGFGARDQATVAGLTLRQGGRPGVLLVGIAVSITTAAFAAWGASLVMPMLIPKARMILAAMALALAGIEALVIAARRQPDEPTASLGALAIVLFAHQLTDAARFLVFAIAVASSAPIAAGIAGAVGGTVLLAVGWAAPDAVTHARARTARRLVGAAMLLIAAFIALRAFGRI